MDSSYLAAHFRCTDEEKRFCLGTAQKLISLAQTARCYGLLELENAAQSPDYSSPLLLGTAVSLIVNGTDPAIVREVLENYLISSDLSNQEFLENMLVYKGMTAIQMGENISCIHEILCSLFGLEFQKEYQTCFSHEDAPSDLIENLQNASQLLESFPKSPLLDTISDFLPEPRSIQRILSEVSFMDMEYALLGSSLQVIQLFLKNLAKQNQQQFFADIRHIRPLLPEIKNSQKTILSVIHKLVKQGEIIICTDVHKRLSVEEMEQLLQKVNQSE